MCEGESGGVRSRVRERGRIVGGRRVKEGKDGEEGDS